MSVASVMTALAAIDADLVKVPKNELNNAQFQAILSMVFAVAGIVAVVFIILGGIKYTMSQGAPAETQKAKDMITYALVGLIIVMFAFTIVQFVTFKIFG